MGGGVVAWEVTVWMKRWKKDAERRVPRLMVMVVVGDVDG